MISLRPAGDYVELGTDCQYKDLVYAAQQNLEIALGLMIVHGSGVVDIGASKNARSPPQHRTRQRIYALVLKTATLDGSESGESGYRPSLLKHDGLINP